MKYVLFCNFPYAFGILKPIADELTRRGDEYLWYISSEFSSAFPFDNQSVCTSITELYDYQSDIIFAPGNSVPWFLRGVKVQVFHGLAGEKKGHFRIRDYFDLYLTQGPYFTNRFKQLQQKHENFQVVETGWCKLDPLFSKANNTSTLKTVNDRYTILYSPTFSPSLTSAVTLQQTIESIAELDNVDLRIKFHDKMAQKMGADIVESYKLLADKHDNITFVTNPDITDELVKADLMISDTSSVIYEFLLLNKPVITLNSTSENIVWDDVNSSSKVYDLVTNYLAGKDIHAHKRQSIIEQYHPYADGQSASRMINAAIDYVKQYGVPEFRKLSLSRKLDNYKIYRYLPSYSYWFK